MNNSVKILGVSFARLNTHQTVDLVEDRIKDNNKKLYHIITGNPEIVLSCKKDQAIEEIVADADLITADGIGIILASKWKKDELPERVTGIDLLAKILERGNENKWSFYFLGTDEDTNKKAIDIIKEKYPELIISGRHNGFFDAEEEKKIIADIKSKNPDILVVALGAPRAERWIYNNKTDLNAKVAFGVGGSLDVIAGKVKRAPQVWQKLNLEWFYRLVSQPSRWRRQLALPVFAWKALGEAFNERVNKK